MTCLIELLLEIETWVSHFNPESKQQSMEWRQTSPPVMVKANQTLSKRKIMATVFWEWRSVLPGGLYATRNNDQLRCATLQKLEEH
ncbi:hypothetical protein TNCV_1851901 [Trichonephila clavipes]|nr:hypothetical protein TNCV_1851901 [Trichonephila clavipes]